MAFTGERILTLDEAADFNRLESPAKVGAAQNHGGVANTGAERDLVLLEDSPVDQEAHGLGEAEGGDGAGLVAGTCQDLFPGCHGDAGETEVMAQVRPGDLIRAGDENHDKFVRTVLDSGEAEDDAADDLLGALATLESGLLEGFDRSGMGEEAVGDGQAVEVEADRGGGGGRDWHAGIIK
jgi:hypothetical protein